MDDETKIIITFFNVREEHFAEYRVVAENIVGIEDLIITIKKGEGECVFRFIASMTNQSVQLHRSLVKLCSILTIPS